MLTLPLFSPQTFHYGNKSHRIARSPDEHPYDLYITKPFESTREAYQLPLTMGIFSKPNKFLAAARASAKVRVEKLKPSAREPAEKTPATQSSGASNSPNLDSDIEALQNGLKRHDEAKGR